MRRKLLLGLAALAIVVAGVAALSAFTAQVVNVTAHAEKDIAVKPIICTEQSQFGADYSQPCYVDPSGGSYGVTLPQEFYDKEIEVTLSNSFFDQDKFFDVVYDVFWECKQFEDERDNVNNITGLPPADGIPDCRDNYDAPGAHAICKVDLDGDTRADVLQHCDPEVLDGNIRDHTVVNAKAAPGRCETLDFGPPTPKPTWDDKEIDFQFSGTLNKAAHKCRYELKFLSPPCEGSFNPFTDPTTDPLNPATWPDTVDCHKADKARHVNWDDDGDGLIDEDPLDGIDNDGDGLTDEDPGAGAVNPQDIDEWADLGDDFKIQIFEHSLAP